MMSVSAPFHDDPVYLTELPEDLRARRAQAARRRRWRRRLAVLATLAVIGAVVAIAVVTLTGSGGRGHASRAQAGQGGGNEGGQASATSYPPSWKPYTGQPPVPGNPFPQLFVPQADFVEQMKWLDEHGYEGVTLDQVEDAWYKGGKLPPKPVVLSFDDGYLSQYVAAFPALEHFHWPGVLNLPAKDTDLPDEDVHKMLEADQPWELASHSITHPDLTTLGSADLEREVADSRRILQDRFGVRVDNFSYPLGKYDDAVISAVEAAGYRGAMSEVPGLATAAHPYILNRIQIDLDDGLDGFVSKLQDAESGSAATYTPSPG
jgi:peptidoglycan/xylan/chitin deacetylase (PgdA/CDA1 family)